MYENGTCSYSEIAIEWLFQVFSEVDNVIYRNIYIIIYGNFCQSYSLQQNFSCDRAWEKNKIVAT